ncbi:uncharacterized protein [Macrobrachium rosenbergii]|uniref:uncharacterized protein n=1 Tax=Macrobrachium rosenbergii TaxID=79674 RepID=UPI0034D52893
MFGWCTECLGLRGRGPQRVESLHQPLKSVHRNLRLRRTVSSRVNYSDDSEEDDEDRTSNRDEQDEEVSYVHSKGGRHLGHPMVVPSTVVIKIQPESETIHRPDLESEDSCDAVSISQEAESTSQDAAGSHQEVASITSSKRSYWARAGKATSFSSSTSGTLPNSNNTSLEGSLHTVGSTGSNPSITNSSQYDALLTSLSETVSLPDLPGSCSSGRRKRPLIHLEHSHRRPMKFLSPEEAAKPPVQSSPTLSHFSISKVTEFSPREKSQRRGGAFGSIFTSDGGVQYAGEYMTEGNTTPVKIRSPYTLKAISSYGSRVDTKTNPVWYSFGSLVVALRYRVNDKVLDVDIVQVTDLPPGKNTPVDLQVRLNPGQRKNWIKGFQPGMRHNTDSFEAKTSIKARKLMGRSFIASLWTNTKRPLPHLALGHAIVPHLEAQDLMSGEWRVFPLQRERQGSQLQDHLGMALVALSCCERIFGQYTFSVDVMQVRNVRVQRFGEGAVKSSKAKAFIWVKAEHLIESSRRKYELPPTELLRPAGYDESQGWEAISKRNCTLTVNVPKDKVHLSSIILEIHGRVRHNLTAKEAHLGSVKLGPEDLFGGGNAAAKGPLSVLTPDAENPSVGEGSDHQGMKDVPGDPLDPRLTHWGQALRRQAKVEMWHRLQI